jgi:hypothetical protein
MEYLDDILMNIGFTLIFIGLWKLGRQNRITGAPDPTGFLYQAAGAFTMVIGGFFMRDAGTVVTCWNVAFGLISLVGYRRLTRQW